MENYNPPPLYEVSQSQPNADATNTNNYTIIQQHTIHFGPAPQKLTCPYCRNEIVTTVVTQPSTRTFVYAILLCAFGCILCSCLPFWLDSCQCKKHICPSCGTYVDNLKIKVYLPTNTK